MIFQASAYAEERQLNNIKVNCYYGNCSQLAHRSTRLAHMVGSHLDSLSVKLAASEQPPVCNNQIALEEALICLGSKRHLTAAFKARHQA
jgi:hypothetical protein